MIAVCKLGLLVTDDDGVLAWFTCMIAGWVVAAFGTPTRIATLKIYS